MKCTEEIIRKPSLPPTKGEFQIRIRGSTQHSTAKRQRPQQTLRKKQKNFVAAQKMIPHSVTKEFVIKKLNIINQRDFVATKNLLMENKVKFLNVYSKIGENDIAQPCPICTVDLWGPKDLRTQVIPNVEFMKLFCTRKAKQKRRRLNL